MLTESELQAIEQLLFDTHEERAEWDQRYPKSIWLPEKIRTIVIGDERNAELLGRARSIIIQLLLDVRSRGINNVR